MAAHEIPLLLKRMGGSPLRAKLANLWRHWREVLGEELADLALPLGAKNDLLIIGAEDAMLLQELHFLGPDILERVNAFLQCDAFRDMKVMLASEGKKVPPQENPAPAEDVQVPQQRVRLTGEFLKDMDLASPVARCYARFARCQQQE